MAALTRFRKLGDERGSQIIEAALVLPLLLLMVLGILDFGLLFWRFESVTNAAREGARVAILPGYSSTDVTNRVQQYLTDAGLTATPAISVVAPAGVDVGGGTCITMTGATVSYPHDFFLVGALVGYFGSGSLTTTALNATAMMRYEGGALPCP
jgi:Flp pilus assembly protein TadG